MFGRKKESDQYKAVEEITNAVVGWVGLRMPPDVVSTYRESNKGAEALWNYGLDNFVMNKNLSADMEEVFAGLDVTTAKQKLASLKGEVGGPQKVSFFRITGIPQRYYVFFMPTKKMVRLKKILAKHNGIYDHWFDFDLDNMIKLPEAPSQIMIPVPPLELDSQLAKTMETIVKAVSHFAEEDIVSLREELSKEHEVAEGGSNEQAYWLCLLTAIQSYYSQIQDNFEASFVIEDLDWLLNDSLGLDVDFNDFYIPEDVGTYKALAIIAAELRDRNILLGWLRGPDEKDRKADGEFTVYRTLAVHNGDKDALEKLFAACGGVVHFDYDDPGYLAKPLRETGVLIDWGGLRLPTSDE